MKWILLGAALMAAACSSPSVEFIGATPSRNTVNGWVIDVYQNGTRAQAIRLNRVAWAKPETMYEYGHIAMERATGCKVVSRSKKGDAVLLNAKLKC